MNPILLAGQSITLPEIYVFVGAYLAPSVLGFVSALMAQTLKRLGLLEFQSLASDAAKTWAVRGIVAVLCVALNAVAVVAAGGPLTVAMLFQSLLSYFAAVTAYEHTQSQTVAVTQAQA